jgi:hypothetical protein
MANTAHTGGGEHVRTHVGSSAGGPSKKEREREKSEEERREERREGVGVLGCLSADVEAHLGVELRGLVEGRAESVRAYTKRE